MEVDGGWFEINCTENTNFASFIYVKCVKFKQTIEIV